MHIAKKENPQELQDRMPLKPLNCPTAFAFYSKKYHAFYKIALPLYLHDYLRKGDPN